MAEPPFVPGMPDLGDYDNPDLDTERKNRAEAALLESQLREVEAALLSTPQGRRWLWALLESTGTFETKIGMTENLYETGFWTGRREVGIGFLRRFATVSPENFARLFIENDK